MVFDTLEDGNTDTAQAATEVKSPWRFGFLVQQFEGVDKSGDGQMRGHGNRETGETRGRGDEVTNDRRVSASPCLRVPASLLLHGLDSVHAPFEHDYHAFAE